MYHVGRITGRKVASPTVIILELTVPTLAAFLPGQWVDFVVPPHDWIGGFSIASSPRDLPNVTLAIKKSNHAPAEWVHGMSKVGQEVQIQVGGSSVLEPLSSNSSSCKIFCAGGIGISPILSQYREFLFHRESLDNCGTSQSIILPESRFFYSVSDKQELVFADELARLAKDSREGNKSDQMIFTLTQSTSGWNAKDAHTYGDVVDLQTGRTLQPFLENAPKSAEFYLCGPPKMLDDAVNQLITKLNVSEKRINYEKWW